MRHLSRPAAPACLTAATYVNWADKAFQANCYPAVRQALESMHEGRCAYCEREVDKDAHVEHFIQRSRKPQLTFEWSNLFLSCSDLDTCGKYKDHSAAPYQDQDVLKPDVDNPDNYLRFDEHGMIHAQANLSAQERRRALETIRVFHLDAQGLKWARHSAVTGYAEQAKIFATFEPEALAGWVNTELANTRDLPFSTAIRHVLEKFL